MIQQNTKEWLELRKSHIGASDAPVIMGVSPFKRSDGLPKTPYVLWQEKLDLLPLEKENAAMTFGKNNEEKARKAYENVTGELVYPHVCFHKDFSYMLASLDGININKDMIVEIKNAGREDHEKARAQKVPDHYYPQLQHQLSCTGLEYMHYFSFHQGEGIIVEVKRDDIYLQEMYEKEAKFWDCLSNFKAPEFSEGDYIERDSNWEMIAKSLWEIKQEKKAILDKENELEKQLRYISEGKNSRSKHMRYTMICAKGGVDYKQIPELDGVDLDQYRKSPVVRWRLTPCK